jgi:hypothetical protein
MTKLMVAFRNFANAANNGHLNWNLNQATTTTKQGGGGNQAIPIFANNSHNSPDMKHALEVSYTWAVSALLHE